jgi:ubiquinone/menaquinone biosynthesis C-methylase UbiE
MFAADPGAALQEIRRVLRPGGQIAVAVWDVPEQNPWATIPISALVELGHVEPPDPAEPGMFVLAEPGVLQDLLESAGFTDVVVEGVELTREDADVGRYIAEQVDLSRNFAEVSERLSGEEWDEVKDRIATLAEPFTTREGAVRFPARSLGAAASA